jgi:hypothetical protein
MSSFTFTVIVRLLICIRNCFVNYLNIGIWTVGPNICLNYLITGILSIGPENEENYRTVKYQIQN